MIVRSTEHETLLITQPDHAALAATIVAAWRCDGLADLPRRDEILQATREHDNGWLEEDRMPLVDDRTGQILDFMAAPLEVRQRIWPRAVERLRRTPYVAAIVAEHALTLFERYRTDQAWRQFFAVLELQRRDMLLECPPATIEDIRRDYFFVNVGDLASLTFCQAWTEPQHSGAYRMRLNGDRLLMAPDPFGGQEIPLGVTARRLPRRPILSREEARDLFERAGSVIIAGRAVGVSSL